jgi:hypothetical protein
MTFGSKPVDGGHLILDADEREDLLSLAPSAAEFIRGYCGAAELMNGLKRYCLWITNSSADAAMAIGSIRERVERVRNTRLASTKASTRDSAEYPWRFQQPRHSDLNAIIMPRHTSERRDYVPAGFAGPDTVVADSANAIYDAEPWLFGLIQSRMHMAWVRAVAGRLKTDFRYSATLVYNTFPVPDLTDADKQALTQGARKVLQTRERYFDWTLAQMYDPDKMPRPLRDAHLHLDEIVDRIYKSSGFRSDEERLALLFDMYAEAIAKESK